MSSINISVSDNYMSVSGELNTELQHHISTRVAMYHVLKDRVSIIRHATVVTGHETTKEKYSPKNQNEIPSKIWEVC